MVDLTVGLDFGTSTTLLGFRRGHGVPQLAPIGTTKPWMPTAGALVNGAWIVGEAAELMYPSTVLSVKRCITHDEKEANDASGETFNADDLMGAVFSETLKRMRQTHPELVGSPIVLGCPAMWNGPQRRRIVSAATAGGFEAATVSLIDEPIAAGIAWINEVERQTGRVPEGRVLVFDCGGGTLDIAVLDCEAPSDRTSKPEITVMSSAGIDRAGDVIDGRFADLLVERSAGLGKVHRGWQLLVAREIKERLANDEEVTHLRSVGDGRIEASSSRRELDEIVTPYMDDALRLCGAALREAKLREALSVGAPAHSPSSLLAQLDCDLFANVKHVVMCGGSSSLLGVNRSLRDSFPNATLSTFRGDRLRSLVVEGLTLEDLAQRLNLHRPGFNLSLRQDDKVFDAYCAFEPLYSRESVFRGESPEYFRELRGMSGKWELHCTDSDGAVVEFVNWANNEPLPWLEINLAENSGFVLYPNGRMIIGSGSCRIQRWPVLRPAGRSGSPRTIALEPESWSGLNAGNSDAWFKPVGRPSRQ